MLRCVLHALTNVTTLWLYMICSVFVPFLSFSFFVFISCLCLSVCHILLTFILFLLGEGSSAREDGAGEEHRAAADPQPGDRPHQGARG